MRTELEGMDTNNRRAVLERITAPFKNDIKKESDLAAAETLRELINVDLDDWIEGRTKFDPKFVEIIRKFMVIVTHGNGLF